MRIRKRAFFEILFPLMTLFFITIGTSFINDMGGAYLRWLFFACVFLYVLLNRRILAYVDVNWRVIFLFYLSWCVLTVLWSDAPMLSLSKSSLFALNSIILLSAGSAWVIQYGVGRAFDWLWFILLAGLASGLLGGASHNSFDSYTNFALYSGLNGNSNAFGFIISIVSPLVFFKLYQYKKLTVQFWFWVCIFLLEIHYLISSYSRSSIVIFLSITGFYVISLPLSKKIIITLCIFFGLLGVLVMMPVSYLESAILSHVFKSNSPVYAETLNTITHSRNKVWKQSVDQAKKGGLIGGGFSVTIGDKFSDQDLSSRKYGREKGNSQLAIMEETGVIGLTLYGIMLILLFYTIIPLYLRSTGMQRVAMGLGIGALVGLLVQSCVEGWWDSAAGPEMISFWALLGVVFGLAYVQKKELT